MGRILNWGSSQPVLHLRQPRAAMAPCGNATAEWARQQNDDLEDRTIGANAEVRTLGTCR
jgi:hypothetical protein